MLSRAVINILKYELDKKAPKLFNMRIEVGNVEIENKTYLGVVNKET